MYHRLFFMLSGATTLLGAASVVLIPTEVAGYITLAVSVFFYLYATWLEQPPRG